MRNKVGVGLILFLLGLLGVFSMLSMELPIPEEALELLRSQYTDEQIKWLGLVNPAIILLISVIIGTAFYDKAGLSVPIIEKLLGIREQIQTTSILKYGLIGGIISGTLLSLTTSAFTPFLPQEFLELSESIKPSLAGRFLYGGITEEILMRYGLMSFIVWLAAKGLGKQDLSYWIGIFLAAFLFAIGHFPVVFQALEEPSTILLSYITIANSVGGIIFGWLYWKKGLESAIIAHIMTHVVMISFESFLS